MNTSNFDDSLCEEAADIHRSKYYNLVLILVVVLNFSGLILMINTTIFLIKTKKISFNFRVLLISLTVSLIARDVLTSFRALYRIYLAITISENCQFISTLYFCVVEAAITSVPFNVALYSFPVISAERLLATLYRKLDELKIFTYLVFVAIGITWTAVTYDKVNTVLSTKSPTKPMSYCSSVMKVDEINYFNYFINVQFIFPLVALAICIGINIFCKNKKDRFFKTHTATHSLTERYNLSQIIRTSQIMLLLCAFFYIMYVLYQLFLLVTVLNFQINSLRKFSIIKEIGSLCFTSVYVNIYGITFLKFQKKDSRNSSISSIFIPSSSRSTNNSVSAIPVQANTYFKFYDKLWK